MKRILTRRSWLAGSLASGCGRRRPGPAPALVSILRAPEYDQRLYGELRRVISEHRLDVRGKRILLKPNLVEFAPNRAIHTHPLVVHAALEAFRAAGATEVRIAEGPGHRRDTLDLAEAAGYFQTIPGFEALFQDLNLDEVSAVRLHRPHSALDLLYLPHTVLRCDLLVSLPKMKTHHWVGATLGMKNLFGVVPGGVYGWPKNLLHWAGIHECIADLYGLFPRQFVIVDGIVAMEGNGPIQGTPRRSGVIVAGSDPAAVDATGCRLMQIDPRQIDYLRLAAGVQALDEARIRQIGEPITSAAQPFELLPEFRSLRRKGDAQL